MCHQKRLQSLEGTNAPVFSDMPRYLCPHCKSHSARRFVSILWHIQRDHKNESVTLKCGISGCPAQYRNAASFKTHL